MSIITGMDVPNDRRTKAEIPPNSVGAGSPPRRPNGSRALTGAYPPRLRFERYVLDLKRGCLLTDDGGEVALRPKAFEFLRHLVANPGRLITKDELLSAVWPNVVVSEDSVVQCVTELRRALGDYHQHLIKTVQRRGYRFDSPVSVEADTAWPQSTDAPAAAVQPRNLGRVPEIGAKRTRRGLMFSVAAVPLLATAMFAAWWWSGPLDRLGAAPPLSIAVLPFKNLSDDPSQEYFRRVRALSATAISGEERPDREQALGPAPLTDIPFRSIRRRTRSRPRSTRIWATIHGATSPL